ncbi:MAG: hypothetical protein H7222_14445 [Methylotenera sp.]|nr:hypothetical protein [Oligoflexia bacterium]
MSFDYDKIHSKEGEHGNWWTSYADLFMMLSIVFLLMFVTSSLRNGSAGLQQQMEYKQLSKKASDLEQQIKVYNTLKDEQLAKNSSDEEKQVYEKLMGQLNLLQDEAKDEKNALRRKAKENEDKEFALNQYQKIVRNIINANVLAKAQIQHRDQVIVTKDVTIEQKKQDLTLAKNVLDITQSNLNTTASKLGEATTTIQVQEKEKTDLKTKLQANKAKYLAEMKSIKSDHEFKMAQERFTFEENLKQQQLSEAAKAKEMANFAALAKQKARELEGQLSGLRTQVAETEGKLAETETQLGAAGKTIEQQGAEKVQLAAQLSATRGKYQAEMQALQSAHDAKLAGERAAFEKGLAQEKLGAAAKAQKMAEFAADARRKAGELQGQLSGLRSKIQDTEAKLAGSEQEKGRYVAAVDNLKKANAEISEDLQKTRAIANARKQLARQISDSFKKAGIKADIDGRTGEVTLDFGQDYFDTGSSTLKPTMQATLDKFIPIYARSLFNDPKVADKIGNIEIIGFASSTYQGRYVNPKSISPQDKDAIDYNLKLSFGRANSIFKHVLNKNSLSIEEQQKLFPLMKVVGRGYLPDGKTADDLPDHMSEKNFCKKYNCQKAQRVVVKFNMKD